MREMTTPVSEDSTPAAADDLNSWVPEMMKRDGAWPTLQRLLDLRRNNERDLRIRGMCEIVRAIIVRDFVAHPKGLQAVPKLTADFLNNFDQYNLTAQEGYLVSLIDGRLDLQKLLILSPFDQFTTLFNLARLEHQRAITIPK